MDNRHAGVVVVDYDASIRRALSELLRDYTVRFANDAIEAWDLLTDQLPSVLISRNQLPGMSGLELFRQVRHVYPTLPLIMLSSDETARQDVLRIGAAWIGKPFSADQLLRMVTVHAGPVQLELPLSDSQPPELPQPPDDIDPMVRLENILIHLAAFGQTGNVAMTDEMRQALEKAIDRFGSARTIADLVGVGEPGVSRWRHASHISVRSLRLIYPYIAGYLSEETRQKLAPRVHGVIERFVNSFCQ